MSAVTRQRSRGRCGTLAACTRDWTRRAHGGFRPCHSPLHATPNYQPLLHALRQLPRERRQLQLSAAELRALVGPLARSTLLDGYWRYSSTAQRNWRAAGFAATWDGAAQQVLDRPQHGGAVPAGQFRKLVLMRVQTGALRRAAAATA